MITCKFNWKQSGFTVYFYIQYLIWQVILFSILIIFLWNEFIFFVFIHARLLLSFYFSLLPLTTAALVCSVTAPWVNQILIYMKLPLYKFKLFELSCPVFFSITVTILFISVFSFFEWNRTSLLSLLVMTTVMCYLSCNYLCILYALNSLCVAKVRYE